MTSTEVERVEQLQRRAAWLKKRLSDYKGKDASYDRAELSALEWAIGIIKRYFAGRTANEGGGPREL